MLWLGQWADDVEGRYVNVDGDFGGQCWDLAQDFTTRVVDPAVTLWTQPSDHPGFALGVWEVALSDCPEGAELRAAFDPRTPDEPILPGDVLIWDFGDTSHIAVGLFDLSADAVLCLSQNSSPSRPDLPGYSDQASGPAIRQALPKDGLVGILRPRRAVTSKGATLAFQLIESISSPNFTYAADCPAAFGYPRNIIGITIHHWDRKDLRPQWAAVLGVLTNDYRNPGSRGVSAHFAVETGRAACLVSPENAAWHAGNPQGNAQTIGLELNPDESAGTYQTAAELIAWLWKNYDIPHTLFPHNYWTGTDCPGDYDLARLRRMAEAELVKLNNPPKPKPAPKPTPPKDAPLSASEVKQILSAIADVPKDVWATPVLRGGKKVSALQELADAKTIGQRVEAALAAQAASIKALAAKEGLDPVKVEAVLKDATASALSNVTLAFQTGK